MDLIPPSPDLTRKVRDWFTQEGYPWEMEVGAQLGQLGWDVFHSVYYVDPRDGIAREVDLYATKGGTFGHVRLSLVIECKTSPDKPWIALTTNRIGTDVGYHLAPGRVGLGMLEWGQFSPLDSEETVIHHSAVQCFRAKEKGTDAAYAALQGVSRAAGYFADRVDEAFFGPPPTIGGIPFDLRTTELVMPVVAVDAFLYEASTTPGPEISLAAIPFARVVTPHPRGERPMLVTVICRAALVAALQEYSRAADEFLSQVKEGYHDLLSFLEGGSADEKPFRRLPY